MINVSEQARKELEAYFEDKEKAPIRVYLGGGCSGPRLALALDEPNEDDEVAEVGGFTFCMNKELATQLGEVALDLGECGFSLTCANPLPEGGGCGGCCGGCGR